jgi:hypothetical protein
VTQDGSQGLTRQIEPAALIPKDITPSADTRELSIRITAIGDRSGSGDADHPRIAGRGSSKRNDSICSGVVLFRANEFTEKIRLVAWSAAEACADPLKRNLGGIEAGLPARLRKAATHSMPELLPAL